MYKSLIQLCVQRWVTILILKLLLVSFQSHDPYKWTLDLPHGSQCSIGWSRSENVDSEGKSSTGRPNEDR